MKKTLLIALLLAAIAPVFAFVYEYEGNTLEYTIIDPENKYVSVGAAVGVMVDAQLDTFVISNTLVIPEYVENNDIVYTVTAIEDYNLSLGKHAFFGCDQIPELVLPSTLQTIGQRSFAKCKQIKTVVIPSQVKSIGYEAFASCSGITTIEFQNAETCTELEKQDINTFYSHVKLIIPNGTINAYVATWKNSSVEVYEKSGSVFSIGGFIYTITDNLLKEVSVREGIAASNELNVADNVLHMNGSQYQVTAIDNKGFYKTDYTSITLGENIRIIGQQAFGVMNRMTGKTIVFPSSISHIGTAAFVACASEYVFRSNTPPALDDEVYEIFSPVRENASNNNDGSVRFFIPCGTTTDWLLDPNWNYTFFTEHFSENCPVTVYHVGTPNPGDGVYEIKLDQVGKITYKRIFTPGRWETLYLPFEVEKVTIDDEIDGECTLDVWNITNGGDYYLATPSNVQTGEELEFDMATELLEKTTYIIQFPDLYGYYEDRVVTFHGSKELNNLTDSFTPLMPTSQMQMAGNTTLQKQTISDEVYVLRATNDFMLQHSATTLHPFECYVMPQQTNGVARAPKMTVRLRGKNDVTTSISSANAANPINYLIDGNSLTVYANGQSVQIYSINGILLHSISVGEDMAQVLLDKGCYIIYSNGNSQKVIL